MLFIMASHERSKIVVSIAFNPDARCWTASAKEPCVTVRAPAYQRACLRIKRMLANKAGVNAEVITQLVLPPAIEERVRRHRQTQEELRSLKQVARDSCQALVGELLSMRLRRADVCELLGLSGAQISTVLSRGSSENANGILSSRCGI